MKQFRFISVRSIRFPVFKLAARRSLVDFCTISYCTIALYFMWGSDMIQFALTLVIFLANYLFFFLFSCCASFGCKTAKRVEQSTSCKYGIMTLSTKIFPVRLSLYIITKTKVHRTSGAALWLPCILCKRGWFVMIWS